MPVQCSKYQQCTDVLVIGNGPSGISLSFLLAGNRPYYNGRPHPNPILDVKLKKLDPKISLVDQDIEYLCDGIEGRSSNPVAVLFDALTRPNADLGEEHPSLIDWKFEPRRAVDHMVLGKTKPGGAWQRMEGSMQTLSLSSWMELPDLPFKEWLSNQSRPSGLGTDRATITDVCDYYMMYVKKKKLQEMFHDFHTVTSVRKVFKNSKRVDLESGETEHCCLNMTKHPFHWEVRGYRLVPRFRADGQVELDETMREEFCISALSVVIATGSFDIPNKLGVPGENLPCVSHSLHHFESVINNTQVCNASSDPVLVIGAGLSAADAILMALQSQVPVVHAFRRGANDSNLILRKLPKNMYPEYHKIHSLMKGALQNPLYKPLPSQDVVEIKEDHKVLLKPHKVKSEDITSIQVAQAAILIGARPDLSFLPNDGRGIGVMKKYPIESKHNPVDIDPFSYQCIQEPGLFAMGPLVGDNFVRFGQGGALGIVNYLLCRNKS